MNKNRIRCLRAYCYNWCYWYLHKMMLFTIADFGLLIKQYLFSRIDNYKGISDLLCSTVSE